MDEAPRDQVRGWFFVSPMVVLALAVALILTVRAWAGDLPDPTKTPGDVATTDQSLVCATGAESYSRQHRQTSAALKAQVRALYGQQKCGEIDHRLPLSLGGADTLQNLWCQPGPPETWNFKVKDRLEDFVWQAVCHRRTMGLAEAQLLFLAPDWRVAYCKYLGGAPCPG